MAIKTLEQFTAEAQTEIDALKTANGGDGMFAQVNNEVREFTDAEYDQAVTDLAASKLDSQDNDNGVSPCTNAKLDTDKVR